VKTFWRLLTSCKTCAALGLAFCLAGAVGSVAMGRFPELFSDMDAMIFARWFARKGWIAPGATLWLYGLLLATGLLAVNAACCTAERLVQIFRGAVTLRRLLPHVMHMAFLGVILSHLASALYGDRIPGVTVPQGGVAPVGNKGWALRLERFDAKMGPDWYPRDASATVTLFRDRNPMARGVVRTNEPLFHEGYGIYLKDFGTTPGGVPFVVFDANRDPGASAILVASLVFTAANILYLIPSRRDDA